MPFRGGGHPGEAAVTVAFVSGQDLLSWVFPVPMDFLGSSGIAPVSFLFVLFSRMALLGGVWASRPDGEWDHQPTAAPSSSEAAATEGTP